MSEACTHLGGSLPVVYSFEAEAAQPRGDFFMGTGVGRPVRDLQGLRPHGEFHDGAFANFIGDDHSTFVLRRRLSFVVRGPHGLRLYDVRRV